ncbi:hypothetical protein CsSME_00029391 [Camellia sinensis var. sinensis]
MQEEIVRVMLLIDIQEHDGFNGDLWNNLNIRQIRRVDLVANPPPNLSLIGGIILDVQQFRHILYLAMDRFPLNRNPSEFNRLVCLDRSTPLANMDDWLYRIQISTILRCHVKW